MGSCLMRGRGFHRGGASSLKACTRTLALRCMGVALTTTKDRTGTKTVEVEKQLSMKARIAHLTVKSKRTMLVTMVRRNCGESLAKLAARG